MKIGLVMEGGASRGNFTNGVTDVFMKHGLRADYVIGASAGIANGVSYVSGQIGRSLEIGVHYVPTKKYASVSHLFDPQNRSFYNISYVFDEIPNVHVPFDYDAFEAFPGEVKAAVTNVATGRCEYLDVPRRDRKWQVILASCALPVLFQPVTIGGQRYMDGGITDPIPAEQAFRDGCDKAIVVLTRERSYVKEDEPALMMAAKLYRRYPEFAEALRNRTKAYNESREAVLALEAAGRVFIIEPETTKGFSRTEQDAEKIRALYDQGVRIAEQRMESLTQLLHK